MQWSEEYKSIHPKSTCISAAIPGKSATVPDTPALRGSGAAGTATAASSFV